MSKHILVAYDGSKASRRAVDFAIDRARARGEGVVIAHVIEWSPYSFLTPDEVAERHARRKQELERAETHLMAPLLADLGETGVPITTAIRYGNVADTLVDLVDPASTSLLMIGRVGRSSVKSRIFGSVAGTLAQIAPVPVTIVP